jgi:hypothetical protein
MEHASYFQSQGSHNPFSFERVLADARASEQCASSMDVSVCNPRKRDRAVFESDDSARGLGLSPESTKRQRFGNYSVTEVDQVFERVLLWLAANSGERLPRTLVELEQAVQFIIGFKASVDPECVFYHLVLNDFLRVSDASSSSRSSSSGSNNNSSFYSSMQVNINPYPANFEGSFLIVFPNDGRAANNSLYGCNSRVSQDFVTALNKAVTWLRSSLQLPATKQGFTTALSQVCISKPIHCPSSLIIERLIQRDIVRVSYGGFIEYHAAPRSSDGQHIPVLQAPTFFTAAPVY